MDAKITKTRLSRMLSYDWFKIVLCALALIFAWMLIFTMTATRVLPSQEFRVANYIGNRSFGEDFYKSLNRAEDDGAFSGETLEIGSLDLPANGSEASTLLEARVTTKELDVMFVSMQNDRRTAYTEKNDEGEKVEKYYYTYLQSFLNGYFYRVHNVKEYLSDLEAYLLPYYSNDETFQDANLNEELVEKEFRARVKRMKDKRYKTSKQIKKGIQIEKERIVSYRDALLRYRELESLGYLKIEKTELIRDEKKGEDVFKENGYYSINLCPEELKEKGEEYANYVSKLANYVSYDNVEEKTNEESGETEKVTVPSALNMNICFFDLNGKEEAYSYEGLVYLTDFVDRVIEDAAKDSAKEEN